MKPVRRVQSWNKVSQSQEETQQSFISPSRYKMAPYLTVYLNKTETISEEISATSTISTDPYYSSVVLLMHMNGTNGSTIFTDQKLNPVTAFGNIVVSATNYKFGGSSAFFDGSGDYLSVAGSSDFDLGSISAATAFTAEFWVLMSSLGGIQVIMAHGRPGSGGDGIGGWSISSNEGRVRTIVSKNSNSVNPWYFLISTDNIVLSTSTWKHVAVVFSSGFPYTYIDGELQNSTVSLLSGIYASTPVGFNTTKLTYGLIIGAVGSDSTNPNPSSYFSGYIDELRITKNVARYTSNFSIPTEEFPNQ